MKIRSKNPVKAELIKNLYRKGIEEDMPVWKAVARALNRPRRKQHEVNLYRIEKYAKPDEIVIVPGVVLGGGEITKNITIVADKFSKSAREKIKNAGGKCMSIWEFVENYKGREKIRIIG